MTFRCSCSPGLSCPQCNPNKRWSTWTKRPPKLAWDSIKPDAETMAAVAEVLAKWESQKRSPRIVQPRPAMYGPPVPTLSEWCRSHAHTPLMYGPPTPIPYEFLYDLNEELRTGEVVKVYSSGFKPGIPVPAGETVHMERQKYVRGGRPTLGKKVGVK